MTEHDAAYWWEQAAFYDGLYAAARQRGDINMSVKFADSATDCRWRARELEEAWP